MKHFPTRYLLLTLAFLAFATSACKGCKDPCKDMQCAQGEACRNGICLLDTTPCDPGCEDDEQCTAGECIKIEAQCGAAGDTCDASRPPGDDFVCLDLDGFGPREGECVEPCAADGSCASGSLCFFITSAEDTSCTTDEDCSEDRQCNQGTCLRSICRPSECDGFIDGADTCDTLYVNVGDFAGGAHCYNVGNGASYCYPAGLQQEDEACGEAFDAIVSGDFSSTCAAGLACVDSTCRRACDADGTCDAPQECILDDADFIDEGVGICGNACTPFEIGSCGAGQSCVPISGTEGVCAPAGDAQAFDACVPGAGDCTDGNICVTFQDVPEIGRCQPICNLTVADPNDDGSIGEFGQSLRDATCPQPDASGAWLTVTHLAAGVGDVDVYVADDPTPLVAALALDLQTDADPGSPGAQWVEVQPGSATVTVLAAGAPRTDPPLAEITVNFDADDALELYVVASAGAIDEASLLQNDGLRGEAAPGASNAEVRVVAALADAPAIDVVLVPVGDDLSNPANQMPLATSVALGEVTAFAEVMAQDWDVLVFAAGDPRTDRSTALTQATVSLQVGALQTLSPRGTADPDDASDAGIALHTFVSPPAAGQGGPSFTCVDLAGGAFGFCQQRCGDSPDAYGSGLCEGQGNGCRPTFLPANNTFQSLCAPVGNKRLDESCDPFAPHSECAEGLYCLEYGNSVANFDALQRGRCTSLCVEEVPDHPTLRCGGGQGCQVLSLDPDFQIGQCGFTCEPSTSYDDPSCPTGLQSCKPAASLLEDLTDPEALPVAVVTQSFCSSSGDIGAGQTCTANDCVGGTECMFPRTDQNGFTSSLVSQYFGAAGLTPTCAPQCDPFEGDSSMTTCAEGETCLFNFPYSAEVGHCAPVEIELDPLQPCSNPGHACGQDSICVVNGQPTCLQFCQYSGPDPSGQPQPETCAAGFFCLPLVNDLGVCLAPI